MGGGLALAHLLEVRLRGFGRAGDEVELRLIELGVVRVCHLKNPALAGVDAHDGAYLYAAPAWDVGGGAHEGMIAPPPPFFPPLLPPPPPSSPPPFSFGAVTAFVFGDGGP